VLKILSLNSSGVSTGLTSYKAMGLSSQTRLSSFASFMSWLSYIGSYSGLTTEAGIIEREFESTTVFAIIRVTFPAFSVELFYR